MVLFVNFKLKYLNIERYETKALEKYLEDMALEGWILSYLAGRFLRFEKAEKCSLKYSIKRSDKDSFFGGNDSEKALIIKEAYEKSGWKLVTSYCELNIFVTEDLLTCAPFDKTFKDEISADISKSQKSIFITLLIYIIVLLGLSIFTNNLNFFERSDKIDTLLFILFINVILILYKIFNLIKLLIFKKNFINIIKDVEAIQGLLNVKSIKNKINFETAMIVIFNLFLLSVFILPFVSRFQDMPAIAIMYFMYSFTMVKIELDYRSKTTGKALSKYMKFIILIIVLLVGMMIYLSLNTKMATGLKAKITLKDFNATSITQEYERSKNNILSQSFHYFEECEETILSYDFIEVKYDFLVDRYYKDTVEYFTSEIYSMVSPKELAGMPPNMRGCISSSEDMLILNVKNKIIRLWKSKTISNEELIKVIYEKLK